MPPWDPGQPQPHNASLVTISRSGELQLCLNPALHPVQCSKAKGCCQHSILTISEDLSKDIITLITSIASFGTVVTKDFHMYRTGFSLLNQLSQQQR